MFDLGREGIWYLNMSFVFDLGLTGLMCDLEVLRWYGGLIWVWSGFNMGWCLIWRYWEGIWWLNMGFVCDLGST